MTTEDFIIELFCRVDDSMRDLTKHPQANLHPNEIVTLAILSALKGVEDRAFYRWLVRDWRPLFPKLPERTLLFRLFKTHRDRMNRFLAEPTAPGVADTYGLELLPPYREGRSEEPIGKKGCSNHRWIVGGKLCYVLNRWGRIVSWDCATANVHDTTFHPLLRSFAEEMFLLVDHGFYSKTENPANMQVWKRGSWNVRMMAETVLSMLTAVGHCKRLNHRVREYCKVRLAFTMAAFNLLVQWHGLHPDENGVIQLSIAEFSL